MSCPQQLKSGEYLLVSLQHARAVGTPIAEPLVYPARPAPILVLDLGLRPVQFYIREGANRTYHMTVLGGRNVRENPKENRRIFAYDDAEIEEYEIICAANQLGYVIRKPSTNYVFTVPAQLQKEPACNQISLEPIKPTQGQEYSLNQLFAIIPLPPV
ncbi:hypothetical protein V8B97DRAFT_1102175 [Scleroderma yunnanense]